MLSESIRFDESASRYSNSDQPVPLGGVPRALRSAAEDSGLDPVAELYNEAIRYAAEGHLRLARERLQMLLVMAPDDGDSRLLLARVHVAAQKWKEALHALDEASNCGVQIPTELRRAIEEHIRAEEAAEDEHRMAVRAREQGELKALRTEARRLRSENASLVGRTNELEKETRKWAWITAGVSSLSILFIAANLLFGGAEEPSVAASPAPEQEVADTVIQAEASDDAEETPAAPPAQQLAQRAAKALAANPLLEGTELEVLMESGEAAVAGSVRSMRQHKEAERVLSDIDGIATIDLSRVKVLALTEGTTHIVRSGDTLSHLAYEYYGDSSLTKPIQRANKSTLRGTNLSIGQELVIPEP